MQSSQSFALCTSVNQSSRICHVCHNPFLSLLILFAPAFATVTILSPLILKFFSFKIAHNNLISFSVLFSFHSSLSYTGLSYRCYCQGYIGAIFLSPPIHWLMSHYPHYSFVVACSSCKPLFFLPSFYPIESMSYFAWSFVHENSVRIKAQNTRLPSFHPIGYNKRSRAACCREVPAWCHQVSAGRHAPWLLPAQLWRTCVWWMDAPRRMMKTQ